MKSWWAAIAALLVVAGPSVAWACGDESWSYAPDLEAVVVAGLGGALMSALVLVPAFLLGRATPRCRSCRRRTEARWSDTSVDCSSCGVPLAVKGAETYNRVWLASAAGALATTFGLLAMSVVADNERFIFVTWLVGLANALALSRVARRRLSPLPRAAVVTRGADPR